MLKKIVSRSRQDGFTLVEMVVVLAIMSILMAMIVPSLTGYVDRARSQAVIAETRSVVMAAQTIISEDYAAGQDVTGEGYLASVQSEILALAEVKGSINSMTVQGSGGSDGLSAGRLVQLVYTSDASATCTYTYDGGQGEYTPGSPDDTP